MKRIDKDWLYAIAKAVISVIVTITTAILVLRNGDNSELFKLMAMAVIGYMFGQRENK